MRHYKDAAEFMSYNTREGGYQGVWFSPEELINDEIELDVNDDNLLQDIINSIDDRAWANPNSYHDSQKDIFVYHWSYFKEVTKHRSRYLFAQSQELKSDSYQLRPFDILNDIGRFISDFQMTSILPTNTTLIRCRQHSVNQIITTDEDMSSPPAEKAIQASRMSPAGIPMFYCAFDFDTAKVETIDTNEKTKQYLTSCKFVTKKDTKIVDFRKLPPRISIFDDKNFRDYYVIQFLHEFVKDLSKGIVRDGREHIEYVPTQILTEFFRYIYPDRVNGIVYPSSKRDGHSSCVLFYDQEESLNNLRFLEDSLVTKRIL